MIRLNDDIVFLPSSEVRREEYTVECVDGYPVPGLRWGQLGSGR